MKFKHGAVAITATAALALTACSGGSAPEAPADGELIPLTVSVLPIATTAPVQIAIDEGIFEKHGLEVEVSQITTGSAAVPSVLNGSIDISYANLVSTIQGAAEGLPLVSIAASDGPAADVENDINSLITRADSGIETAEDLEGKTVAINALNGLVYLMTRASIDELGGDSSTVEFVEIPFPEMAAALEGDRVDAVSTTEPLRTITMENSDNAEIIPVGSIGGSRTGQIVDSYFTSEQFLQENEEAVAGFRAAIYEAQQIASEDSDRVREAIAATLEIPEPVLEKMRLPLWASESMSQEDYEYMSGLMVRYELLTEEEVPSFDDVIRD